MAKIFDMQSDIHESPNRNNHDLMHKRHMSGKFGYIYPFLAQPVVPTDEWEIDTAIGVNLMPMWYPTQSNMRFIVHYFFVPYRIMYDDWKNFVNGLDDNAVPPYHDIDSSWFKTGTLADYLGIPTELVAPPDFPLSLSLSYPRHIPYVDDYSITHELFDQYNGFLADSFSSAPRLNTIIRSHSHVTSTNDWGSSASSCLGFGVYSPLAALAVDSSLDFPNLGKMTLKLSHFMSPNLDITCFFVGSETRVDTTFAADGTRLLASIRPSLRYNNDGSTIDLIFDVERFNNVLTLAPYVYMVIFFDNRVGSSVIISNFYNIELGGLTYVVPEGINIHLADYPLINPWCNENTSDDKDYLDTFAARAYEMTYNAFYRNQHGNQPFVVDGETKYNQYLPSTAGDADTYRYELHKRNWELDAYTSCLPSPQQGNAPLVGVTLDGQLQIRHDDGSVSTADLRDLDDAKGLQVVRSNIANAEDARTIISMASSGMTIADFRQGNALQRFLEQSLRSGFRYADFIYGHFGKSPSHQELDMPVFLGGYTQVVDVNKVTNVTASEDAKLGQFAGSSASFGSSQHKIHHYFDDYGIVLGLMMLVPDPAYSQILPKHFLYRNRLDFYFPQFSQLGLQPITYSEICPIQSHAEYVAGQTDHKLTDTFGYQRPNHELVWIPDTVHGLFRTSLSGSVIQRRFSTRPELSDEFLTINPDECNDIFSVIEDDDDTWIGQVVVGIKAKRPVPHVVVPSLGR